jgi:curved DNA-binding protein CbpA
LPADADTVSVLRKELTRLQALNPFQILNIPPDAGSDAVRDAFLKATKQFHPVRFARESAETRDLANEIFLVVRRAYSLLGDEERRRTLRARLARGEHTPPPQPVAPPPPALGQRNPEAVRALFEEVRTRSQRYDQAMAVLGEGKAGEARRLLQILVMEDPRSRKIRASMHYAWALECHGAGRTDEAVREIDRALALAPDDADLPRVAQGIRDRRDLGRRVFHKAFGR